MAKLTDFLAHEGDNEERALIQGKVPPKLRSEVVAQMKRDKDAGLKVTWDSFLAAACKAYLTERTDQLITKETLSEEEAPNKPR